MEAIDVDCAVFVDTNILLDFPQIETLDWGVRGINVFILKSVVRELDKKTKDFTDNDEPENAEAAKYAYEHIKSLQDRAVNGGYPLVNNGCLFIVDAPQEIPDQFDPGHADHQQIALAATHLIAYPDRFCAIVTRDREMTDIAHIVHPDLQVVNPGYATAKSIRERLRRLIDWNERFKHDNSSEEGQVVKPALPVVKPRPDPQAKLQKPVAQLYALIRAAHHRAVLAISPMKMRLALSAHLISILTAADRRTVFLFVPNKSTAEYWAKELQRRCNLPQESIVVFGEDPVHQLNDARVVLFRHSQLERRLYQYVARFKQGKKRVTALVDGCDRMDPVAIAMLLFNCDQFVGFSHLPAGHTQAIGSKMLDAFFQQETIATYTFADAECDYWLHRFDVLRRPIALTAAEKEKYREVNDKFLELHRRISRKYLDLGQDGSFWENLPHVLARTVDYDAPDLFKLREQREAIAQQASEKLETVVRLVNAAGDPARCLIFDYENRWTAELKQHLSGLGKQVAALSSDSGFEEQRSVWAEFKMGFIDALIVQDVPIYDLRQSHIHRLILLTPFAPLTLQAAITDWVLNHAMGDTPVSVDLLYTVGTPEWDAMVDFADTYFGVRFA